MSETATEFVRRHRLTGISRTKGLVLMVVASVADDLGRARMTQPMIATDIGCTLVTVKRAMRSLLRPEVGAPALMKVPGRMYVVVGVAEHEPARCPHPECQAESQIDSRATEKRRKAAARARRHRERQRAARDG